MDQQIESKICKDLGHKSKAKFPPDFKKIRVYFSCDVKNYGLHKMRLAVDGYLTGTPLSSAYSRLVSLKGIRLFLHLVELNGLES